MEHSVQLALLFNIFLEIIIAKALVSNKEEITIGGTMISNLQFADDIVSLSEDEIKLQDAVASIAEEQQDVNEGQPR